MQKPFEGLFRRRVFIGPVRDCVPYICEAAGFNIIVFGHRWKCVVLGKCRRANLFWLSFAVTHRITALG